MDNYTKLDKAEKELSDLRLLLADKDKEIEELKTEIEELNESIIWWSNRFNALQRDNSTLMEEIEKLKKELTEEKNAYIKMYNMYVEKEEEIERLEYLNKQIVEECQNLDDEVLRLNNIINELNDMFYETFRISQNGYYSISEWELKEFTDKIKELKGSDKE